MHVVIFEGVHWQTFAPLALSRPVFMLATGMSTLLDKQIRHTNPTRLTLWVRPEMAELARQRIAPKLKVPTAVNEPLDDEPALLLSGRTLHFRKFDVPADPAICLDGGNVLRTAYVKSPGLGPQDAITRSDRWLKLFDLPHAEPQTRLVERLWDLIKWNDESLAEDFVQTRREQREHPKGAYHMLDDEHVWIGEGTTIQPGVVLDATKGPVTIDHHAHIGANSVIQGPCYVGPHVEVKPLTQVRPGTSIGMMCRVGGEISHSILFGYTNKAHDGYLGDSYVGKWCNLGAGTATSNLKNTYGEITVTTRTGPEKTGRRFLGSLIGDHARTAIGTRLMAGSYIGFSSMLATSAIAPRYLPSFAFRTDRGPEHYKVDKAIEVMRSVYARRDRTWDAMDEHVVRYVAATAPNVEAIT